MSQRKSVNVMLWEKQLGAIIDDPTHPGRYLFQYADDYPVTLEPSPIQMPVGQKVYGFDLSRQTFQGLPGMISDSLPDRFGNALVDQYMSNRGIAPHQITTLDRLLYTGKRGMGALEYEPAEQVTKADSRHSLAMSDLVESARKAIAGNFSEVANELIQIGTSAGGARPKAVIGWNRKSGDIVAGQFDLPTGYEHWLLKFDGVGEDQDLGGSQGYGRIEYVYHQMAVDAGIEMSECTLLQEGARAHFMTRRFDRKGNDKLHLQSFCALAHQDFNLPYVTEYTRLMRVAQELNPGKRDVVEIFRRMVFNVLANNCDDHTKNFAFLMDRKGKWKLAPAYDVTHAHNPAADKWTKQHQMLVNGKAAIHRITRSDLLNVAKQFAIKGAKSIIQTMCQALSRWDSLALQSEVPKQQKWQIGDEINTNLERFS